MSTAFRILGNGVRTAAAAFLLSFLGCAGGMPSVPGSPEAVLQKAQGYFEKGKYYQANGLFKAFLERYPGHMQSDVAQYFLAECHFSDEEYPLASVEYRVLVSNYGYSEYVDDAFFKIALCAAREAPRSDRDQTKSFEALSLFEQFLRTFPTSPHVPEANVIVNDIRAKLAMKDFKNGYFYYRRQRFEPATIYFDKVINEYSGNEYWLKALVCRARIMIAEGNADGARELLNRAMEYPGDSAAKAEAGEILQSLKKE